MQEHIVFAAAVVVALSWCVTIAVLNRRIRRLENLVESLSWRQMRDSLDLNELAQLVHYLVAKDSQQRVEHGSPRADSQFSTRIHEDAVGLTERAAYSSPL